LGLSILDNNATFLECTVKMNTLYLINKIVVTDYKQVITSN